MLERDDESLLPKSSDAISLKESTQERLRSEYIADRAAFSKIDKITSLADMHKLMEDERLKFIKKVREKAEILAGKCRIEDVVARPSDYISAYPGNSYQTWLSELNRINTEKQSVLSIERYIYSYATEFLPLTTDKTKLQAKKDAWKSYYLLLKVTKVKDDEYSYYPQTFKTIHDKALRNCALYIAGGIACLVAAAALVVCVGLLFAVMGLLPEVGLVMMGAAMMVGALLGLGIGSFIRASEAWGNHRKHDRLVEGTLDTVWRFFHDTTLFMSVEQMNTLRGASTRSKRLALEIERTEAALDSIDARLDRLVARLDDRDAARLDRDSQRRDPPGLLAVEDDQNLNDGRPNLGQ